MSRTSVGPVFVGTKISDQVMFIGPLETVMSSPEPPAEEASQQPPAQGIIPDPPPKALGREVSFSMFFNVIFCRLANCDALKNPPPSYRRIQNNRITPAYLLAWTFSHKEFHAYISDDRWQADSNSDRVIVRGRLSAACGNIRKHSILPCQFEVGYVYDGEVYLGVMFNSNLEKHYDKLRDVWMDDSFSYLRNAFGIPKNTALDETLAWYRFPPHINKDYKAIRWRAT